MNEMVNAVGLDIGAMVIPYAWGMLFLEEKPKKIFIEKDSPSKNKETLSFHLNLGKITRTRRFDLENSTKLSKFLGFILSR